MKRQDNVTTKDHDNHSVMEPKDKGDQKPTQKRVQSSCFKETQ